ncbi:glycosyltransferase family 1 protein [Leclercia adecarboxylata]|uniref:glycosyltransferase n=1 Tax=Leclercia adecarboxylata TaxID=83655 RepID=UPI00254C8A50|nr:glycosyltransferase family 1 protein [Leclercia adecarboxylata]MDK4744363.1 glycosyltransferase family 1 protein [Leclercia adecarboxylata]
MNKLKVHVVSRQDYIATNFADFQTLLDQVINPDDIPHRFYCGGRGVWTFQTLLSLNYYYNGQIECSWGTECRADAINLMHNDHFGSRVKPWVGVTVVARADRPPVLGADYVVEQNSAIASNTSRIYIPHWPQPGLKPRESENDNVNNVAYFGGVDSFPEEYQTEAFKQRLADQGISLRISFDNWTDYQDVDICISFRKSHDHKLARKPASKLINNWLGRTVMVCDDEPSFRAIRESEFDYLIAKTPDEAFEAIMRLKNNPDLYRQMREQGDKRLQVYSREAVAARWFSLFEDIWRKGLHKRPTLVRALRFGFGKAIRPLTKKF